MRPMRLRLSSEKIILGLVEQKELDMGQLLATLSAKAIFALALFLSSCSGRLVAILRQTAGEKAADIALADESCK